MTFLRISLNLKEKEIQGLNNIKNKDNLLNDKFKLIKHTGIKLILNEMLNFDIEKRLDIN